MADNADGSWCAVRVVGLGVAGLASLGTLGVGCLDRPLAETHPETTNVIVMELQQAPTNKVDLLFMIDNSMSMADKQAMLADAVPALVNRLISPRCVDPETKDFLGGTSPCSSGIPEFRPVEDIHLGVISSSLGGHGAEYCASWSKDFVASQDDGAHLLGERRSLASNALGFLAWTTQDGDPTQLVQDFATHVTSAGQTGCGYEASLESWYRFLIDPEPPAAVNLVNGIATPEGVDDAVLAQRAAFLRPDSLVAVVMLSDENDCSIMDGGQAWYIAQHNEQMFRSTAVCEDHPNDVCCRSCGTIEDVPPAGCAPISADPGCAVLRHDIESDDTNLRCWDQKRRFGVDYLYPIDRYVSALTQTTVKNRVGEDVQNPLFTSERDPSLIFLAGIVGVPWQDIATEASLAGDSLLSYLSARELHEKDRWSWLRPNDETPPGDPFMIESRSPRSGVNPATGLPLTPPDPSSPNPINGAEWLPQHDLQYACIYPLAAPRDCAGKGIECDCSELALITQEKKALCRDPATGTYGTTQYFAKAYPGTRQLSVLEGVGDNAIVASICPKVATGDSNNPSYGYNPAVDTIVDRFGAVLTARCMPRELQVDPDGTARCAVVEALGSESCACDANANRKPVSSEVASAVRRQLAQSHQCGGDTGRPCESLCLCEIGTATDLASCQNDPVPTGTGWCYVDPARGMGNPALVAECPPNDRRLVRFAGEETPAAGADVFIACLGAPIGVD